jgi:ubiquinone/menaquinone biosynthesis C-methylase UbiE
MTEENYVIATGRSGRDRLKVLTGVVAESTDRLLDRLGIAEEMSCLDVGSGGGDVAVNLARRVGPTGRVLGVDRDAISVDIARDEAVELGLTNVTYQALDVYDLQEADRFDLVFSRFLLSHLPDARAALTAMVGALAPGGVLAVEDVEMSAHFCYPDCPAFRRYVELYVRAATARGDDPDIGPRLPSLLHEAGLREIDMSVVQPAGLRGDVKLMNPITMENISDAVVSTGLASAAEVADIIRQLYAEAGDEHTVLSIPRIFQVWGRKT